MRQTIKGKPPSFTSFASSVADSKQTLTRGLLVISPQDRAKHYLCNLRCRIAFSGSSSTIISSLTYNQESKRKTSINAPITYHSEIPWMHRVQERIETLWAKRRSTVMLLRLIHILQRQDKLASARPGLLPTHTPWLWGPVSTSPKDYWRCKS